MQAVLNATDVRKNWSEFIDGVVQQNKPQFVSRNNKEPFLSLNIHQAKMVFFYLHFHFEICTRR